MLLVLNGYYTHTRNVEVIEKEIKKTSYCMTALGLGFMFPIQTYNGQEIETWSGNNPNRVVTPYSDSKFLALITIKLSQRKHLYRTLPLQSVYFTVTTTLQFIASPKIRIIIQPVDQRLSLSLETQNVFL